MGIRAESGLRLPSVGGVPGERVVLLKYSESRAAPLAEEVALKSAQCEYL